MGGSLPVLHPLGKCGAGDAENLHPASSIQVTCSLHTEHSTAVLLGGPWVASRGENVSSRSWDGDSAYCGLMP